MTTKTLNSIYNIKECYDMRMGEIINELNLKKRVPNKMDINYNEKESVRDRYDFENVHPEDIQRVTKGLESIKAGRTHDLGSFAKYVNDED